jgi:hypothetical protein
VLRVDDPLARQFAFRRAAQPIAARDIICNRHNVGLAYEEIFVCLLRFADTLLE